MTELVLVSGADEAALAAEVDRLAAFLDRIGDVRLLDVAYTCSCRRGPCTLAVIADSAAQLRDRLLAARPRLATAARIRDKSGVYWFRERLLGSGRGKLAFVYPGVNGFYPDMLRDLAVEHLECRGAFDELEEALSGDAEFSPSSFIFPPAPYYRRDADIFRSGAYAQALVATYAGCVALTRLMAECGLRPQGVVGFGGGDLAAMMRSGAAGETPSRPDRIRVIRDIYAIVRKAVNHGGLRSVAMVTVLMRRAGEAEAVVAGFPEGKATLVVDFSPRQKTYAVEADFADAALAAFAAAHVRAVRLALDRPFGTSECQSLVPEIRRFATSWMKQNPVIDVYSCASAKKLPGSVKDAREDTAARWVRPVRFTETVRQMYADGYCVFLEAGPRGGMTAAVSDTLKGEKFAAIALNSIHRSGLLQLQHAVGELVALGAEMDISGIFARRHARLLDFDGVLSLQVRRDSERRLSRAFPKLTILSSEPLFGGAGKVALAAPKGRGARAAARAAAVAQQARRQRQFDFGAVSPLVSDAEKLEMCTGFTVEICKTFLLSEIPFISDCALGTSQMSYADPNLRGLVPLTPAVGMEIMAETASMVMPGRMLRRIEDLKVRKMVSFEQGALKLFIRAERVPSAAPDEAAVKVIIRDDTPNSVNTWPVMEATMVLADTAAESTPVSVEPLLRPRSVHWSDRDIYPARHCAGKRLRGVSFVEAWSETGLDYEVTMPDAAGAVAFTRFPIWMVNPLLIEICAQGFALWRSHEKFAGAFSFPFRLRRLTLTSEDPKEGSKLKCYMRLTGVTPKTQYCDITLSDGNGKMLAIASGWEELTERVPTGFRELVLQPAMTYLSSKLGWETIGRPKTEVATAYLTDVPYPIFERNDELWLKTFSHIVLDATERREFAQMTGPAKRRTEWLFGRIAAKEAVRRFLNEYYQARWSDADVRVWADELGKPHALGQWNDYLATRLDLAIAHTEQFVIAVVAANSRVGVDVESAVRDLSREFIDGVFLPEESEFAAKGTNSSRTLVGFWCAKEAVSKALGTGIRYSPKEMNVVAYDPDCGEIAMRLNGGWEDAFKSLTGRDLRVTLKYVRDHAVATCFIPQSFFGENP